MTYIGFGPHRSWPEGEEPTGWTSGVSGDVGPTVEAPYKWTAPEGPPVNIGHGGWNKSAPWNSQGGRSRSHLGPPGKRPIEAMKEGEEDWAPRYPSPGVGPTLHDRGMQMNQGITGSMLNNALGTPGFVVGSGKDAKYVPGRPSAAQGMVNDVNAAWADYARRQGALNAQRSLQAQKIAGLKEIMAMGGF